MDMNIEFTRNLYGNDFKDIRIAVRERPSNLLRETEEQSLLVEKILYNPHSLVRFEEYRLLMEMCVHLHKMWTPNSILKVYFFRGFDEIPQKVLKIASEWSEHANIIFEKTDKIDEAQIRVSFDEPGSWSYIGTDALGVPIGLPTVNFGWLNNKTSEDEFRRVVLHEFGHILGLVHEHQSPSIKINWNKSYVYWYCKNYYNWDRMQTDINIINEYESTNTKFTTVDIESIMAYNIPPQFVIGVGSFPMNYNLSDQDKNFISQIYP